MQHYCFFHFRSPYLTSYFLNEKKAPAKKNILKNRRSPISLSAPEISAELKTGLNLNSGISLGFIFLGFSPLLLFILNLIPAPGFCPVFDIMKFAYSIW